MSSRGCVNYHYLHSCHIACLYTELKKRITSSRKQTRVVPGDIRKSYQYLTLHNEMLSN